MDNKNLFAPPTKEELEMFAAPTEKELGILDIQEPSMLEEIGQTGLDVGRGVLSGLTFGGLEELTAAAKAGLSSKQDDFAALYKKYLEIEEQKEREAKERSPIATTLGEIGGGLIPAALTAGAGLLPAGGAAAARLTGAQLAKAAAKGAATGIVGGAVSGGLTSQEGGLIGATEEEKEKLLEDIKSGVTFGGVLGGAAGVAAPSIPKAISFLKRKGSEALESTLFGKQIKKAFEMGEAGESVLTGEGAKQAMLKEAEQANKITTQLLNLEDAAANEFKDPLRFAGQAGKKVILATEDSAELVEAMQKAGAPSKLIAKTKQLLIPQKQVGSGLMGAGEATNIISPYEAYEFRRQLQEEAAKRPELKGVLGNIVGHIDEKIESVFDDPSIKKGLAKAGLPSSYKEGLNSYRNFVSAAIESILEEGRPAKQILTAEQEALRRAGKLTEEPIAAAARGTRFRDLLFPEKELQKRVTGVLETLSLPSEARKEAVTALYGEGGFVPMLKDLAQKKPEAAMRIAQRAGVKSPDELISKLTGQFEEQSMESAVRRIVGGVDTTEALTPKKIVSEGGLGSLTRRGATSLSMIGGVGVQGVKGLAKTTPVKLASSIYKLPDTGLRSLADTLEQSGNKTFTSFAQNLKSAIDNGDTVKKQAILFSLMQNPKFREQFSSGEE